MIRPTDLPISIPSEGVVRRVEPQSESKEFGDKDQPSRRKQRRHTDSEEETQQDTVDVSEQYLNAVQPVESTDSVDEPQTTVEGDKLPRHLDIEV